MFQNEDQIEAAINSFKMFTNCISELRSNIHLLYHGFESMERHQSFEMEKQRQFPNVN